MKDAQQRAESVEEAVQQIENFCDSIKKTLVARLQMGAYKPIFSRGTPGAQYLACLIDHDLSKLAQGRVPQAGMSEAAFDLACKFILYAMYTAPVVITPKELRRIAEDILKAVEKKAREDIVVEQDKECYKDFDAVRSTKKARKPTPKKGKKPVSRRKTRVRTPKKQ